MKPCNISQKAQNIIDLVEIAKHKEVLNTDEVTALYGLSDKRLKKLRAERAFRYYRQGGKNSYLYRKSDIEDYLFAYPVESAEALAAKASYRRYISKIK